MLCCGYSLTDFAICIRLTSLALWQSNDCPSASKATLMNMDKYFMWIHYERLHNHNKAKHNKTVCIFLGIYCKHLRRQTTMLVICSQCFLKRLYLLPYLHIFIFSFQHKFNNHLKILTTAIWIMIFRFWHCYFILRWNQLLYKTATFTLCKLYFHLNSLGPSGAYKLGHH